MIGPAGTPRAGVQVETSEPMAVLRAVAHDRAAEWFPELAGSPVVVDARTLSSRPRSTLVLLRLTAGGVTREAVAKLRRDTDRAPAPSRPGLAPMPLGAGDQCALEVAALRGVERMLGPEHPRLRPVRALDHVPSHAALVMERVDGATGRATLTGASRLAAPLARGERRRRAQQLFGGAGEWLRRFHATTAEYELADRRLTEPALEAMLGELAAYLSLRVGGPAAALARRAGAVLPPVLGAGTPVAVGHGDFAVRNTLLDGDGRVAVVDPMPRWRTPVWEDLARFTVSARLQGLQVHAQGLAYDSRFLDQLEHELLTAYLDGDPEDSHVRTTLAAAALLVLFDKWSALVSARPQHRQHPRRPRRLPDAAVDRYVMREARRLLALVEAGG